MSKTKKKQLSEVIQKNKKQASKKTLNPFEIHINKDKQNVLGKKSKVDRGLPGISRAKAIKKRKNTILQEYKLMNKSNLFLDKRIGEKNFNMSEEDKAIARFAAERMRSHKKQSIFNLNDEEKLTHRGQTLEEIEKFDDPRSDDEFSDDENRTGKLDSKFTDEAHFGGGTLSRSEPGMSRKDLIEQLIAESKKRKAEKQKIREQTQDLTEKLDTEWKDLLPVVSAANKSLEEVKEVPKADAYDIAVRQLKFEPRGVPSDKLKSEEEIIQEEKEKLEALEKDRLARMKGFVNDQNNTIKHKSADDLDDGFVVVPVKESDQDQENSVHDNSDNENDSENANSELELDNENDNENANTEVNNGGIENDKDDEDHSDHENSVNKEGEGDSTEFLQSDSSDSDDSTDNLSDLRESESSSDEESPFTKTVTFAENGEYEHKKSTEIKSILKIKTDSNVEEPEKPLREFEIREDLLKRKEIMEKARKELPYTYKAPENYEELQAFLQNQSPDYQAVIVDRIIKCNHWSLNGTNKEKMSTLFSYLLHYMNDYINEMSTENVTKCFHLLDRYVF